MSFPEGPPSDDAQRYATDGRDADGTSATASADDSTTAALLSEDPSEGTTDSDDLERDDQESAAGTDGAADWDSGNRNTAVQRDGGGERASTPGGALGPGTTATGAGTSLD